MRRIGSKDTRPELAVRHALFRAGLRYRLSYPGLPYRPDLVFPGARVAVFVHGCFWHGHDCPLFKWPVSNHVFWSTKIQRNRARDVRAVESLAAAGWRCLTVWECALRGPGKLPRDAILAAVRQFLASPQERHRDLRGACRSAG